MKALVLAPMTAEALASLRELLPVTYESWADTQRLADPEELTRRIEGEGFWILVVEADFLPEELFQQAPTLRLVAVCRNSVAHVDLAAATSHGVAVVNTPGRNTPAVAELTIGLMLALSRRITSLDGYVKAGRWQSPVELYFDMHRCDGELAGKTLGIIGLGRIGCRVAGLARAFDMRVLAFDPYLAAGSPADPDAIGAGLAAQARPVHAQVDNPSYMEAGGGSFMGEAIPMPSGSLPVELMSALPELVSQADYISVHVPDTPDTQGLLNREVLAAVKPGCRIINTSSYYAVDEEALVEALQAGRVAGAAFDVFQTHPIPPNSPLLRLDNVVLTPHVGGATQETVVRHSKMVLEDVTRFMQGQRPEHLVNPEVWDRRG